MSRYQFGFGRRMEAETGLYLVVSSYLILKFHLVPHPGPGDQSQWDLNLRALSAEGWEPARSTCSQAVVDPSPRVSQSTGL